MPLSWGSILDRNALDPERELPNIVIFQSRYGQLSWTDTSGAGEKKPKPSTIRYPVVHGPWGVDRNAFAINQQYQGSTLQHASFKYLKLFLIANIIRTPDISRLSNDLIPGPFNNNWGIQMKMSDSSIGVSLNHSW